MPDYCEMLLTEDWQTITTEDDDLLTDDAPETAPAYVTVFVG